MHLPHSDVRRARRSDRSLRRRSTLLLFVIAWGCTSEPVDEIASISSASVVFTPVVDTRTRTIAGPPGGAPPSTFRETDVVHVGGDSSTRPPLFVTASGTGGRVFLKSWQGSVTGGVAPTELGTSPIVNGHDVRLHALTPDTSPKSNYRIVVSGMVDLFTLWITTWRVASDGSFTQLDSLGYGGTSKPVVVFDIAHRPITTTTGGVGSFVVTTPVRLQGPDRLRVVTWVVDAVTGDISAGFESAVLSNTIGAASNVSAARESGHEFLPEYVAISVRNNVNDLATYFVQPHPNGFISPHGQAISGLNIGGTATVTEPIYATDVHALTGYGMVTAIERLDDTLDLVSFDNRINWNEGPVVYAHEISSDSLDLLPAARGVEVAVPNFLAQNTLVADADYASMLYTECSDFQQGIASVTKSMTLLVALDAVAEGDFDLDALDVEISAAAASVGGSQTGFTEGETHSLRTLLWGLMVDSGNDAALAIAEHVGGTEEAFVDLMNAKAADLGMGDSIYCQPAGGCFSTVVDQAHLWSTVAERADFQEFAGPANLFECGLAPDGVSDACYFFDKTTDQHPGVESWKGGSLGFFCGGEPSTEGLPLCASGGCLSAQARRIDRTLVISELQPSNRSANRWSDARKLWDFGYRRIFTPDFLGTRPGRFARDFGIDYVRSNHVVTAIVRSDNQVELCSQAVSLSAGTVSAPACRTATDPGLPVSAFIPIAQHVEIEQLSNAEADGDYIVGQRAGTTLGLGLWRVGPHEVPDHVEGSCCGDGIKQGDEDCDGNDFGTQSCGSLGWDMGSLECTEACRIDIGGCYDGPGSVPPGTYGACGYDAESCDNSPAHCDGDGSCLGGPCLRTDPNANPLDPLSGYHPDGNFVDEEGNLYYCPDPDGEEWVCSDEDGWGVCRRCADSGELSTRIGCGCTTDDQCDNNEPGLGCYGEDFAGSGYCYSATAGPPYWQCEEGACGTAPYYSALWGPDEDTDDVMYCHHYWMDSASDASCQVYYNCNSILADICTLTGDMCTYGSDECTEGQCCENICSHDDDCAEAFGWPAGYVCDPLPGECIPEP
jgi:hypothetical protein